MTAPGEPGRLAGDKRTLAFERRWPFPPAAVWRALTDPALCGRWFAHWSGAPGPGDVVELELTTVPGRPVEPATVTACEAPSRLLLDWDEPDEALWQVEAALEADGDGTRVTLTHRTRDKPVDAYEPGWRAALERWLAVLEEAQPAT